MELHFGLLLKHNKNVADKYFDELLKFTISINDDTIKLANDLKLKFKERKLSYIDCVGYTLAKLRNIKFLTGDKQFKDLENVEFVK